MIIDTHTHVVSSDRSAHPLHPDATGWSLEVSNNVEDLINEMDNAGVECATLVQPNGTYGLDNSYQCDSALRYAPRTVAVGILDPAADDAADKLSYWTNERGMWGVRLQSQAEPDDPRCDALWDRAESLGIPISIGGGGTADRVNRMRNIGSRHPNVLFAPGPLRRLEQLRRQGRHDRRPGTAGHAAQRSPEVLQHQPRPLRRPVRRREGPVPSRHRGLHPAPHDVGLQLPVVARRWIHRPGGTGPKPRSPGSPPKTWTG